MLDLEVNSNDRTLTFVDEDLEYSVLAPNYLILGRDINLQDDSPELEQVSDNWKKRKRYLHKCKVTVWKRWAHEYLVDLRERSIILAIKENL